MRDAFESRSGSMAAFSVAAGLALVTAPAGRCGRGGGRVGSDASAAWLPSLTIVLTSDVGGGLSTLAQHATLVDQARVQSEALVQVDAGDLFPADVGADDLLRRARLLLAAYARMGVDALVPGENELALGPETLRALTNATGIPLLAANLVRTDGEPVFAALRLVHTAKWPIGIFGIVAFSQTESALMSKWGLRTTDPIAAARAADASLRAQGAKLVVGCLHVAGGLARARAIAARTGGVDVVVLGHREEV